MNDIETRQTIILVRDLQFAHKLASRVIFKPELSVWMILVPIFFIYYFWRLQKFSKGRGVFVKQWMRPRRQTLEEAWAALEEGRPGEIDRVIPKDQIPPGALGPYRDWIRTMLRYYTDLLRARGDDYNQLVRDANGDKTTHLMVLNQLTQREKRLDKALQPHLEASAPDVAETIRSIESASEAPRREEADRIFRS
ncbi:MAG: hypothetical protein GY859_11545 [Desulfobacterales bacterium]|nr:hypothetical protein [Desulfobacterales bacterium]